MTPVFYGVNLLDAPSIVTVSGEATGKPKERLFDRDIGLPYQDSASAGTRTDPKVDQGAGGTQAVDTWAIAAGHNLSGAPLSLESSPDDTNWTVRDSLTPSGNGLIFRSIASVTARYWRHQIIPGAAPSMAEFFLTQAVTLASGYLSENGMEQGLLGNVLEHQSRAGYVWEASLGPERWVAKYPLRNLSAADKTAMEALFRTIKAGAKFLWIKDADGVVRWVKWESFQLRFSAVPVVKWDLDVAFTEVL